MKPCRLALHPISLHELTYPFDIVNIVTLIIMGSYLWFGASSVNYDR